IVGYGDYKLGDTIISRVYYVEGLKHNLFSVGQFCDGGLEVAFRQHSCHIRNYDMVDLLKGSWTTNLYSISLNDMMSASPVCLLTKASSTKSCGNTNTEVLLTLHMDLCGPIENGNRINGKMYVLVIVDDSPDLGWIMERSFVNMDTRRVVESVAARSCHLCERLTVLWAEAVATACYTLNIRLPPLGLASGLKVEKRESGKDDDDLSKASGPSTSEKPKYLLFRDVIQRVQKSFHLQKSQLGKTTPLPKKKARYFQESPWNRSVNARRAAGSQRKLNVVIIKVYVRS
ncbi:hypothetical protein Tco_0850600, partial [Tanacetum coccineum]